MNILLVGFDFNTTCELAMKLAKSVNFEFKNSENILHKMLIKSKDFPIILSNNEIRKKEVEILKRISQEKDVVISMTIDSFVSDDHYEIFNNSYTVLIKSESKDEIKNSIEKLVASKVKMVLSKSDASVEKLKKIIF